MYLYDDKLHSLLRPELGREPVYYVGLGAHDFQFPLAICIFRTSYVWTLVCEASNTHGKVDPAPSRLGY